MTELTTDTASEGLEGIESNAGAEAIFSSQLLSVLSCNINSRNLRQPAHY